MAADAPVRRFARKLCSVPVTLRHLAARGIRTTRGISLDISEGGLGALVKGELSVGETVEIDLQLHAYSLRAVGIVRHSSSVRSGFEFLGLTAAEREHITSLVGNA